MFLEKNYLDKIPEKFRQYFSALLGNEIEEFLESLIRPPTQFIRINTLKVSAVEGRNRLSELGIESTVLPWFSAGLRIHGSSEVIHRSREYALGYFYFQEGASMIPAVALQPESSHHLVDMCAAPGSKTTQLAQMMQNHGAIIANDRNFRRITSLGHNLQFCGVSNTVVTCEDGRGLAQRLASQFHRVLVDAPCTASGVLRSRPPQFQITEDKRLSGLQTLQKGLLTTGYRLLKPGGRLVYSTCSLHPEENEDVVQHLLRRSQEAQLLAPQISHLQSHPGLCTWENREYSDEMTRCLRIYPHDNDTDGFFLALLEKPKPELNEG